MALMCAAVILPARMGSSPLVSKVRGQGRGRLRCAQRRACAAVGEIQGWNSQPRVFRHPSACAAWHGVSICEVSRHPALHHLQLFRLRHHRQQLIGPLIGRAGRGYGCGCRRRCSGGRRGTAAACGESQEKWKNQQQSNRRPCTPNPEHAHPTASRCETANIIDLRSPKDQLLRRTGSRSCSGTPGNQGAETVPG